MERARFWIDFDNGDICREDGVAIASLLAPHCEHTPEELQELAAILDAHAKYPNCIPIGESRVVELEEKEAKYDRLRERVRILREALSGVLDSSEDGGDMNDIDWSGIRAALEATKEEE